MKIQKIKLSLQRMLMNFGETPTDKGTLEYVGESLEVGTEVFIDDVAAPDGEYETETQVIVVVDGVVAEIKEKEVAPEEKAEEEPVEEAPVEEEVSLEDSLVDILQPLTEEINTLKAELEAIKARMSEIETKLLEDAAKPAEEEFKNKTPNSNFFRN